MRLRYASLPAQNADVTSALPRTEHLNFYTVMLNSEGSTQDLPPRGMDSSVTCLTHPVVCDDSGLLFSAYGQGWGYAAVKLPAAVIRDRFGVTTTTPDWLLATFELHKVQIALAISRRELPSHGERIKLDASDF